jgi:hypothetical protein
MDIVLGVSMAPETVRMVLVEGENADGVTVEADEFPVAVADGSATSAPAQVVAAILGTREGAAEVGYRLMSTGVTWTEPTQVSSLRDALDVRQLRGVMLVSPLLAAAALTQTVGAAMDYEYTALLFIEPRTATLATVDTADGSIVDLHRQQLECAPGSAEVAAELAAMVGALDALESRPDGVFIVGCGVDIVPIKRHLHALISVPLSAPEEPDTALARGAAVASATAPLFTSSTAALAYAQDPGTGEVKPHALAPAYLDAVANASVGGGAVAYSALADDDDSDGVAASRPFLLTGTGLGAIFLIGLVTLLISLSADFGPRPGQRNSPHAAVMPTKHITPPSKADAPAAAARQPAAAPRPAPAAAPPPAPAPPPQTFTAPTPVMHQLPQRDVPAPPVRRAPSRPAPAEVPAPAEAPAPPPAAPPPPPAAPPPAPAPQLPPMVMYLHLPFVSIPIPLNPPPPPPPPPGP